MLFDDLFLHKTGSDPEMPKPRYAVENWFFAPSSFPRDYLPLALQDAIAAVRSVGRFGRMMNTPRTRRRGSRNAAAHQSAIFGRPDWRRRSGTEPHWHPYPDQALVWSWRIAAPLRT